MDSFGELTSAILRLKCEFLLCVDYDSPAYIILAGFNSLNFDKPASYGAKLLYLAIVYSTDGQYSVGLLLNASNQKRGQYKRVGVFTYSGLVEWAKLLKDPLPQVEDLDVVETIKDIDGKKWHIIDLI